MRASAIFLILSIFFGFVGAILVDAAHLLASPIICFIVAAVFLIVAGVLFLEGLTTAD